MKAWIRKALSEHNKLTREFRTDTKVARAEIANDQRSEFVATERAQKEAQAHAEARQAKIQAAMERSASRRSARQQKQEASAKKAPDGRGVKRAITPDGRMLCRMCRILVPLSRFYLHRSKTDASRNYDSNCDHCRKAVMIARHYGMTASEYKQFVIENDGGKCNICGAPPEDTTRKAFHVDHCHSTGRIRGILCSKCNRGIEGFRDSPDLLRKAAEYLMREPKGKPSWGGKRGATKEEGLESGGSLGTHSERG